MIGNKAEAAYYKSISSGHHKNGEVKTKNPTLAIIIHFLLPSFSFLKFSDLLGFILNFETILKKAPQKP